MLAQSIRTSRFLLKGGVLSSLCRRGSAVVSGDVIGAKIKQTTSHQIENLPAALQMYRSLISRREIHKPAAMEVMHHYSAFLLPPATSPQESESDHISSPPTFNALVVVNQPIARFTPHLWQNAQLKVCADGGANRIFEEMPLLFPLESVLSVRKRYKPDVIIGDLDSIRPEVMDFYASLGTEIIDESYDQDTTDLHKSVSYVQKQADEKKRPNLCILVTSAFGGRFDHTAASINALYKFPALRIILLSRESLVQLLPKNHHHEIHIDPSVLGPTCGLIPVGMPCSRSTTTTGLEWNLYDTGMMFGGLVSTSNLVEGDKVTVESSSDLLWAITIKETELTIKRTMMLGCKALID